MSSNLENRSLQDRSKPPKPLENVPSSEAGAMPDQPTEPDLPMSMTASMILTSLPKDATQALKEVENIDADKKVTIRFSALPGAPNLGKQKAFKISASQRFEAVVSFLRKRLGLKENEALFCYINSVFAPGLDEGVGNLWRVGTRSLYLIQLLISR